MKCPNCQHILRENARFCDNCGLSIAPFNATTDLRPPDPLIGRVLDSKYELVARLGEGGMGAVYRARRIHIGDEAAVKVLHKQFVADEASIERFRREARAAAMLRHTNVVAIYDFGEARGDDAPAFIVMELVEGESLRRLLKREGKIEPKRAVALMRDICAGVGAAHRRNIVHRDLKPDNIIVLPADEEGEREIAKVVDFGIAKLRDLAAGHTLTQTGMLIGTPYYMSPEQCRGESLDARSDVYSLGAVLYEMLTGRPPFLAETVTGIITKHLTEAPPPFPPVLDIPRALESVVMRALAKDPDLRQADALTLARELRAAEVAKEEEARRAAEAQRKWEEERHRSEEEARQIETEPTLVARPAASAKPTITNSAGIELVLIPAGSFMMGSENGDVHEKPVHRVTISKPFYMGKYEVTQAQWQTVMGNNPSSFKGDNLPVEQVSWNDVQEFIRKLNAMNDGYEYHLPSEAEWEYACRAGTTGDYAGDLDLMAWYGYEKAGKQTHPVGQKQPNAFGLYDMHGNVWEWCADYHHENYNGAPSDGSAWMSGGDSSRRVLRGGSWNGHASFLRSAFRHRNAPDSRFYFIGFRVVAASRL